MADRALHIGIDARELLGQPTGVGHYLRAIVETWATDEAARPHRFTFFAPARPAAGWLPDDARFALTITGAGGGGTWWEQTALPRALATARPDVFLGPAYSVPLRAPCPSVVFLHDMSFFAHPEWFGWREGVRRRTLARLAARRARLILTLSAFSADEIRSRLGVASDRILQAPPGGPPADAADPTPRAPVVLYVGSLFTRRRIPDLIGGFAQAVARVPAARLVLVGDNRTHPHIDPVELAADAGVANHVEWRQYVSDDELAGLYRRARVFAMLSEYEGYLMTPLEAFAHGVPAVLLDTPIAREAYGTAATLVGPGPDALAAALVPLLTDEAVHARVLAAGRARLHQASWTVAARQVLAALARAADPS